MTDRSPFGQSAMVNRQWSIGSRWGGNQLGYAARNPIGWQKPRGIARGVGRLFCLDACVSLTCQFQLPGLGRGGAGVQCGHVDAAYGPRLARADAVDAKQCDRAGFRHGASIWAPLTAAAVDRL